jgi:LPP20 lipoprotein
MQRFLIIVLSIVLLASCAAKKQAAEFEAQPSWVKQKPIVSGYYIGVASVKKVGTSAQYIAKARQEALTDLAEGVSSNVSSTSVLHSIETEYGFSESFDQKIKISTDDYLEGFDPVESYESESSYWVYYKIAKSTYHEMKEKRKREAIATALAKYESGLTEQNLNKPKEALSFYLQGLQAIKRYLGEETPSTHNGNNVDIGNELYSSASAILNSLEIIPKTNNISVKRGESFDKNLVFVINYDGNAVQGIPVEFSYTGGYLKKDRQNSDAKGKVYLEPEILHSRNGKEQITAKINLKELSQKAVDDLFIRGLITKRRLKPASVNVIIEAPSVSLVIDESSCLINNDCNQIKSLFSKNASEYGFEVKEQSSDFVFKFFFVYKKGESAGGLVSAYISGEITIKDNYGKTVWVKQTVDIKGVGRSKEDAKTQAFSEFKKALNRNYFKQGLDAIK